MHVLNKSYPGTGTPAEPCTGRCPCSCGPGRSEAPSLLPAPARKKGVVIINIDMSTVAKLAEKYFFW
jgi:hypothetical protein